MFNMYVRYYTPMQYYALLCLLSSTIVHFYVKNQLGYTMSIGERLKAIRKDLGLSQEKFSGDLCPLDTIRSIFTS